MKVLKYPIRVKKVGLSLVKVPLGAKVMSVFQDGDILNLYAMIDPEEDRRDTVGVWLIQTGQEVESDVEHQCAFMGTFCLPHHPKFIFHVFVDSGEFFRGVGPVEEEES